jgi:hypothetical protein
MLIQKYKESWIEDFTAIQKVINEALVNGFCCVSSI